MSKTVLVTGATGFLGHHLILECLKQGYLVRGTVRSLDRAPPVERIMASHLQAPFDLEFCEADLMQDKGWAAAVDGCDYVLHSASPFLARVPKNPEEIIAPAREGTLRVLKAASAAGVKRVVLTSSVAAIAYSRKPAPFDENDWTDVRARNATPYYQSKTLAEQAAWSFAHDHRLDLAVINPSLILGPVLGNDVGTSAQLIRLLMTGAYPGSPRLGFSIVDVRDVAAAHLLAMTNPAAAGQRFIAAGRSMWVREIADVLRQAYPDRSAKIPKGQLPDWLVKVVAMFDSATALVVKELGYDSSVSNAKARAVLGWTPRSEEEAILATAQSLIEKGLV